MEVSDLNSVQSSSSSSLPDSKQLETYSLGRNILNWIENHLPCIFRLIACIFSIKSSEEVKNKAFQGFLSEFYDFELVKDCRLSKPLGTLEDLQETVKHVILDLGRQSIAEKERKLTSDEIDEFNKLLKEQFGLDDQSISQLQDNLTKMALVEIKKVGEFYEWNTEKMTNVLNYFHQVSAGLFLDHYGNVCEFQSQFFSVLRDPVNKEIYGYPAKVDSKFCLQATAEESKLMILLTSVHEIHIKEEIFGVTFSVSIAFNKDGEILFGDSIGKLEKSVSNQDVKL
jgi:hypothetical protein